MRFFEGDVTSSAVRDSLSRNPAGIELRVRYIVVGEALVGLSAWKQSSSFLARLNEISGCIASNCR